MTAHRSAYGTATVARPQWRVNGQCVVPVGGQLKVPTSSDVSSGC